MEHFRTSRLTAERLHEGHLADLVALHLDPDVSRYLGGVRSPEATKTYLTVNMAHWDFRLCFVRISGAEQCRPIRVGRGKGTVGALFYLVILNE
jgi:hypothetical protein